MSNKSDARDLGAMFAPRSVVVVGASRSPGRMGYNITKKLLTCGYNGEIFAVVGVAVSEEG
jgi:acetate---CoA ligase (ADP-forming)